MDNTPLRLTHWMTAATGNKQDPWINSSVKGRFYFCSKAPGQKAAAGPTSAGGSVDRDTALWKSFESLGSADAFRVYLQQFPEGAYAGIAKLTIASLAPVPVFKITSLD